MLGVSRLRRGGGAPDVTVVDVSFEERYWYPDDGGIVWLSGYSVVDRESGRYLARDAPQLAARGKPLTLRRDPDNPHDPNAIAVEAAGEQVGWVPREIAEELAPELDAGRAWSAVVLREQRPSPRDPRSGLTMLLAAAAEIELRA